MGANNNEGVGEKIAEFFTQKPSDHKYEKAGGDARVPEHERTGDPKADANDFAKKAGEQVPHPGHERAATGAADPDHVEG